MLTKLSQEHKITVSCMCSDHSKFTAAARSPTTSSAAALDIAAIDGEIVGPGSPLAREVASELSTLDANYRPNEIGSPFAIAGPGYFTDAAHQNHLHVGFKQAITPDWKPPADVAAARGRRPRPPPRRAGRARRGAPARRRGPEPPKRARRRSCARSRPRPPRPTRKERGASQAFLKAVEPPRPAAAPPAARRRRRARAARRRRAAPPPPRRGRGRAPRRPPTRATTPRRSRSPPGWPGRRRSAACRRSCRSWPALVESGLKNLNFGDADSVGFFQMRVGIWNQGAYAGYPDKPELQIKWFLDQAEAVKRQRLVAGKPIDDPNSFGEWIADVERPAEQYRGRYQLKLEEANGLLQSRRARAARRRAAAPPAPPTRPRPRRAPRRSATRSCRRRSPGRCRRRSRPATRPGPRRWPRSRRPRSTSAPTTSGAARRRRPASTAPA